MNYHDSSNRHPAVDPSGLKMTNLQRSPMAGSTALATASGVGTAKKQAQPKKRRARNAWTAIEDAALLRIVENHVFDDQQKNQWAQIAKQLTSDRSGKQCRDRWQNHLRPDIKKGHWTKEEEQLIREMHKSFGTKWSCMAKLMKNRTDNDIKNKWYSMMRKEKKASARATEAGGTRQTKADPPSEDSFEVEQFEDAECLYDNITYQDLVPIAPEANDAYLVSLSAYAPPVPYNWPHHNPYATYVNPQPMATDQGPFVMMSDVAVGQVMASGATVINVAPNAQSTESIFRPRTHAYGSNPNVAPGKPIPNHWVPTSQVPSGAAPAAWANVSSSSGIPPVYATKVTVKKEATEDSHMEDAYKMPASGAGESTGKFQKDRNIPEGCGSSIPSEVTSASPTVRGNTPNVAKQHTFV